MSVKLAVEGLRAGYNGREILDGISFEVPTGEVCVLLGTNGAGKSTTLGAIVGVVQRMAGRVMLDGANITRSEAADNLHAGVAMVPEGARVFRDFSVRENLMLGAYTVRDPAAIRERIERVHELFPILAERAQQLAGTLSGGERAMLAMGRALMSGPSLLLLDEPFLGLSPAMCHKVMGAIAEINRERGVTVLVVEQNPLILEIANRALVMQLGEIILAEDDPQRLMSDGRLEAIFMAV